MNPSYDDYADSDEDQHDAYLERMKEEGKIREENANDSSDDSGEETGGPPLAVLGHGGGQTPPWARAGLNLGPELGIWVRGRDFRGAVLMHVGSFFR